jgi:hypothetical protein
MVEHHLVVLAPDARLLVAAERRVRRVGVVAPSSPVSKPFSQAA